VETWTSAQSGAGDANVYLQLNPMSAVEAAASVTVQVQYDTESRAILEHHLAALKGKDA
jgi:hypothetical protein